MLKPLTLVHRFLLFCATLSIAAQAQQFTKVEAGLGTDSQTYSTGLGTSSPFGSIGQGSRYLSTGVSGLAAYNLSPSLAIEGSVSYLPTFQRSFNRDAGNELTAFAGIKMGWRGKRFGVYGKIEPGLASFSCGLSGPLLYENCQRRTHFALQYGGVAEYYWRPRTTLRVDAAQTVITEFDQVLARGQNIEAIAPGHVAQHFDFRFTVEHRFGAFREAEAETVPPHGTLDAGALFALQARVHLLIGDISPDRGGGVWVSWNFTKYLSWDTSAFDLPTFDHTIDFQDGGTSLMAVSGIKAGIRRDRVGIFAKVRPGAIIFSATQDSLSVTRSGFQFNNSRFVNWALDTGGVIEVYPVGRLILRAEAGNASIFYRAKTTYADGHPLHFPGFEQASALLLFGAGYRF